MNPFTHAHSFETPGFYICSIIMCQKLPRSADQSLPLNTFSWQEFLQLFTELRFDDELLFIEFQGFHGSDVSSSRGLLGCDAV